MIKCLLSRPGLIAGPLHSTPLQIISQSIPRLDPIDSKSSCCLLSCLGVRERGLGLAQPLHNSVIVVVSTSTSNLDVAKNLFNSSAMDQL